MTVGPRIANIPTGLPITSAAMESILQAAASKAYDISLFTKERNGKPWLLVLVGEGHAKNQNASEAGRAFLDHFKLRGLEGADLAKTWGGRAFEYIVIRGARLLSLIFSFGKIKFGSTIDESEEQESLIKIRRVFVQIVEQRGLERMSEDELQSFEIPIAIAGKPLKMNGIQIMKVAFGAIAGTTLETDITNIHLEKGHQPDIYENLASVYLPTALTFEIVSVFWAALSTFFPIYFPPEMAIPTGVIGVHFTLGNYLARFFDPLSRPLLAVNPWHGLTLGRDKTMARNIVEVFQGDQAHDSMLAIAGKKHVPGISALLVRDYGFEKFNIP